MTPSPPSGQRMLLPPKAIADVLLRCSCQGMATNKRQLNVSPVVYLCLHCVECHVWVSHCCQGVKGTAVLKVWTTDTL